MAIDLARYEELRPGPRAVFDRLEERRVRVRFMVREGDDWRAVTPRAFPFSAAAVARATRETLILEPAK